jgi:hypothetical protein
MLYEPVHRPVRQTASEMRDKPTSTARLDGARRVAERTKVGAAIGAVVAFVAAVPLVRATHGSHPRRTHPLTPPSDFLAAVSVDSFGAGDLAPGEAPPVVSSGGS